MTTPEKGEGSAIEDTAEQQKGFEVSTHDAFPGYTIVSKGGEQYALKKNEDGTVEGFDFRVTVQGGIQKNEIGERGMGWLKNNGGIAAFEEALANPQTPETPAPEEAVVEAPTENAPETPEEAGAMEDTENTEGIQNATVALGALYRLAYSIDPFGGDTKTAQAEIAAAKEALEALTEEEQGVVAESFFNSTIGESIANNGDVYKVCKTLSGTPFAEKVKQLESDRLESAGFNRIPDTLW